MENIQLMIKVIMQAAIEAAKTAILAMTEAAGPAERTTRAANAASTSATTNGPSLKQPR